MKRALLRRADHPLARSGGRVLRARMVLFDALNGVDAPCHWCGRGLHWRVQEAAGDIRPDDLLADHLDGDWRNDDPRNLVPACRGCNGNRGRRKTERPCDWCGQLFMPRRPESKFCSVSCGTHRQWADGRAWASEGSCRP